MTTETTETTETENTSLSSLTRNFQPKGTKVSSDMRAVTVGSRTRKDKPALFSPFVVTLPSSYLAPIALVPEIFREPLLGLIDSIIRGLASSAKKAGKESVLLAIDAGKQLVVAAESTRLSQASITAWFNSELEGSFSDMEDEQKRERFVKTYRLAFVKLATATTLTADDLGKLANRLDRIEDADSHPLTAKVLAEIEDRLMATDTLAGLE